ncbi:MAG: hypothetical protein IJR30_04615, partial [Prevotella sp.]|nr:hypothetical protein [Prevotella sp.]
LKKYHYPPEEAEHALDIVLKQCEEWTDDDDYSVVEPEAPVVHMYPRIEEEENMMMAAEDHNI